jgi:hypothetical protein
MKDASNHIYHYLPLIGILLAGFVGMFYFSFDRSFQFVIMTAMSFSYVTWGVVHHYVHDDLHITVVLEYIAVAILGMTLVFSVLLRA